MVIKVTINLDELSIVLFTLMKVKKKKKANHVKLNQSIAIFLPPWGIYVYNIC